VEVEVTPAPLSGNWSSLVEVDASGISRVEVEVTSTSTTLVIPLDKIDM
jgi:hypothetical protein